MKFLTAIVDGLLNGGSIMATDGLPDLPTETPAEPDLGDAGKP